MAGGIDWFRWHHGSVTDPKFQLIARKSGASLPDVLAVWAYLLEQASANETRGDYGDIDCEAVDCMFNFPNTETRTADILKALEAREMLAGGHISSWDKRQPKRERDTDNSAERTRAYRERQRQPGQATESHVTPCDASERQRNARGEESREEKSNTSTEANASVSVAAKTQRPSRKAPASFALTAELREWAAEHAPGVDAETETAKFLDHTFTAAKSDWLGTWRNWMRKANETRAVRRVGHGPPAEPEWVTERKERARQFLGPSAAKPIRKAEVIDMGEIFDAKQLG